MVRRNVLKLITASMAVPRWVSWIVPPEKADEIRGRRPIILLTADMLSKNHTKTVSHITAEPSVDGVKVRNVFQASETCGWVMFFGKHDGKGGVRPCENHETPDPYQKGALIGIKTGFVMIHFQPGFSPDPAWLA